MCLLTNFPYPLLDQFVSTKVLFLTNNAKFGNRKKKREDDHLVPWALGEKNGSLRDVIGVGGVISSGEYFEFPLTL